MIAPGVCRHCGCSEVDPCSFHKDGCVWTNGSQTVCESPVCRKAEAHRVRVAKAAATPKPGEFAQLFRRGWGHGAIVDELRRRKRRGKG